MYRGALSGQHDRIYHVHIRKSAGSSINAAFLSRFCGPEITVNALAEAPKHRLVGPTGPAVGWNRRFIEKGCYAFAFSHIPFHQLKLPRRTFTFTIFRDPVERAYSHYAMLKGYLELGTKHPCLAEEGYWAEGDLEDFLDRAPREHLQNQLYMFSANFDVDEAARNILKLSAYGYFSEIGKFVDQLGSHFSTRLPLLHRNRSPGTKQGEIKDLRDYRDIFDDEYRLLSIIGEMSSGA